MRSRRRSRAGNLGTGWPSTPPTVVAARPSCIPGDGRFGSGPSKVRPEAARALADVGAHATSAPATASPACASVVGSDPRRARRAVLAARRLRGAARQRREHRCSGTPPRSASSTTRAEHLVFGEFSVEVRRGHRRGAVPRRPGGDRVGAGHASRARRRRHRRRVRVPAQRDVDRRDDRGAPPRRRRPRARRRAPRARPGCRVDADASSTCTTSRRRSASPATAASGSRSCSPAAIERIERLGATDRWVPPSLSLPIALENSRLDQTYNTPRARRRSSCSTHSVRWMLDHGGLEFTRRPLRPLGRAPLRLGRGEHVRARRSWPSRRSAAT